MFDPFGKLLVCTWRTEYYQFFFDQKRYARKRLTNVRDISFFAIEAPGLGLADCLAHRRLLEAYGKVHRLLAEAQ